MPTSTEREAAVRAWYAARAEPTDAPSRAFDRSLLAPYLAGADVLDIGVSTHHDAAEWAPFARTWTAVDFLPEVVERCRTAMPTGASWDLGDARALPYPDARFDIVLSLSTVDHIVTHQDRVQTHREAVRVLRPGGVYVFTYPDIVGSPGPADRDGDFGFAHWYTREEAEAEVREGAPALVLLRYAIMGDRPTGLRAGTVWQKP